MDKNNEIPSVPTSNPDLNKIGLKNLAAWIARYNNFGLRIDEVSPFVKELLENGTLAQFEPSLTGLKAGYCGGEEDYERYEFNAQIDEFVNLNVDWAILHFTFQSDSKCLMFIECANQSESDKLPCALEAIFNVLEVDPLTEENSFRDISWEEADEIILKYLKYMNNPEISSVPEEKRE